MNNAFILIKFEKLKLISISAFYQILLWALSRQDQYAALSPPTLGTVGQPRIYIGDLGTQEVDIASRERGGTTARL